MKKAIQIFLAVLILLLIFFILKSIQKPINFEKQKKIRYDAVIENLKDIRKAEIAYKNVYEKFTGSFDTLINFVKTDSFPLIKAIGRIPDNLVDSLGLRLAEKEALKRGIISRDTIKIAIKDSIYSEDYPIDKLSFVPYAKDEKFILGTSIVKTGSGVKVPVFEAKAENFIILNGLDRQLIINLNDGKEYPGLKVGSLIEATNNAGNWE